MKTASTLQSIKPDLEIENKFKDCGSWKKSTLLLYGALDEQIINER